MQGGAQGTGADGGAPAEPSVEDVLASIRRILDEDQPASPAGHAATDGRPGELLLDVSMLIEAPHPTVPALVVPLEETKPTPVLAPEAAAAATLSFRRMVHVMAATAAPGACRHHHRGPGAPGAAPAAETWLNTHLPPLVERVVRAEIERVAGKAGSVVP